MMARVLSKLGFEVSQALNGMEGMKELQTTIFYLVLCNFLMLVTWTGLTVFSNTDNLKLPPVLGLTIS